VDNLKRLPVGADGRVQRQTLPAQNGDRSGQLDIPVESWEAYKTWCDRVRENWRDDRSDPPATPPNG
jgi:hypothetical protein